jgi:hypothetical protein
MKKRLVFGLVSIAVLLGVTAATGIADPDLTTVPPHRHWLGDPANGVQIGPRVCDNPNLQNAFNQFHNNLHIATASSIGPAAPGLHNGKGGDIRATTLPGTPTGCGLPTP